MKVITFSTKFQATHPRKGQPTYFVEKIVRSLHSQGIRPFDVNCDFSTEMYYIVEPKHHTIRAGERWKVGEWFSPRIWSGKPYASKQIEFAPPIQIKKIWTFEVDENGVPSLNGKYLFDDEIETCNAIEEEIAKNDGLTHQDWDDWLIKPCYDKGKPFVGQILCWNESIEYCPTELPNLETSVATKAK